MNPPHIITPYITPAQNVACITVLCRLQRHWNKKISFNPFPGKVKTGYGSIFANLMGFCYCYSFCALFGKLSYCNQLNTHCHCVILQLKHHIADMFPVFVGYYQGDHTSVNEYTTWSTIKCLKLYSMIHCSKSRYFEQHTAI